jgi:hypothetical protein
MRLTGTINVDGKRVSLDWKINGVSVVAGPGLSADDVKVHTYLPDLKNATEDNTPLAEVTTNRWDALTVTELRVELQNRSLTVTGNKADLIARLLEHDNDEDDLEGDEEDVE